MQWAACCQDCFKRAWSESGKPGHNHAVGGLLPRLLQEGMEWEWQTRTQPCSGRPAAKTVSRGHGVRVANPDTTMQWVACCLGFFGTCFFFRIGEITDRMTRGMILRFTWVFYLLLFNVAVDNPTDPEFLWITIKQLKTDPFTKGKDLYICMWEGRLQTCWLPLSSVTCGKRKGKGVQCFDFYGHFWLVNA